MPHSDAAAFLRTILSDPRDPVPRLVLADWLDEQGGPSNAAWANYLRLRVRANSATSALTAGLLREDAAAIAPEIGAELTLRVGRFLTDVAAHLDLLPGPNFFLQLDRYRVPRPVVGLLSSEVARRCQGVPLGQYDDRYVVAMADPRSTVGIAAFEKYFGAVLPVKAAWVEIGGQLDRLFRPVMPGPVIIHGEDEIRPATLDEQLQTWTAETARLALERIVAAAETEGATGIEITASESTHMIRYLLNGRATRRHEVRAELGRELVRVAWVLPPRVGATAVARDSSFGPGVRIGW